MWEHLAKCFFLDNLPFFNKMHTYEKTLFLHNQEISEFESFSISFKFLEVRLIHQKKALF